jgi:hypothetical protein
MTKGGQGTEKTIPEEKSFSVNRQQCSKLKDRNVRQVEDRINKGQNGTRGGERERERERREERSW